MSKPWLNYHHLLYFWHVAKKGSISATCKELRLSQPTISAQIKALEEALNQKLFSREGRYLKLTEAGQIVYRYADDIFTIGHELLDVMAGHAVGPPAVLKVGIADVVPKFISCKLLEPAFALPDSPQLRCYEDKPERLISSLAIQELDLVLTDAPMPPSVRVKAYNHFLGESDISFMASEKLAKQYRRGFPQSLHGAPLLLPLATSAVRQELDRWFESEEIRPNVIAEFEDRALMKIFGRNGLGIFLIPSVVEDQLRQDFDVKLVGRTSAIKERFYIISVERKVKHPAVVAICDSARDILFEMKKSSTT